MFTGRACAAAVCVVLMNAWVRFPLGLPPSSALLVMSTRPGVCVA